ncbi:MAG TPA: protein kinase [Pirellula sp.]|nr:protein kinase [Pirellula sp.]
MDDENSESLAAARMIDVRCDEFQSALTNGSSPKIESFLVGVSPLDRQQLLKELIGLEVDFRVGQHEQPVVSDYAQRFPSLSAEIASILRSSEVNCDQSTISFSPIDDSSGQRKRISEHKLIGRKLHIYQCVSLLGAGAMGHVYLALHDDLKRHCALKILMPKHGVFDNEYIAQFQQEGQAAAALIHPNIVGLHAIGCIADTHFLEMEYVPGISLQQLISREAPLPTVRALRLATMVADGLAAAHRAGIIHRDVKPDNVLVTPEGIAKVGDFGLAKRLVSDDGDEDFGKVLCGTPNYMAPELFQGLEASPASDVYALGLCLFQMLVGKMPWQETSLTQLARFGRTETIPNVRDIRPELSPAIAECVELLTASSLFQRPANAVAAAKLLHAVMGSERDIESLLIEAFANDTTITWNREGELYSLTRQLPGNRRQIVFVETTEHATLDRILLIYSTCCDANPNYYEHALRQNWIVMHGSLAIRDIDGKPMFVVINAYPRSTVAPEEVRRSVIDIAAQADEVERQLTGADRY